MHELKIYRGVMCNDTEEWWKIWRGNDLFLRSWQKEFDEFWFENLKVSKIYTLMGCFWPKYIMFELIKYRGVMFDGTEYWCKICKLWFGKWHEQFDQFSPEHTTVTKLELLYKAEIAWAEHLQGSYVLLQWRMMQKMKRNWLVSSKLTWGIWRILTWALKNLKNVHFNWLLLNKIYNLWANKVDRSYVWWHWILM